MAQAQAAILVQARDQASQQVTVIFNNVNQQLAKTAQGQTAAATAADKHKFSIVDLAAKLYLLQVGFRNVIETLKEVKALAEFGAELEQQDIAFRKIVEGAGKDYVAFMKQLQNATNGTISNFQLQQVTADALIGTQGELRKEMANSLPNLLAIAKAYSDLHPEVGSTEKVFEALTNGIRRGSPRLIDNAKIILGLTESYEAYAQKVGKTVDQLTEEEQQLAVLNMVNEKGKIILDQAGDSLGALTDRYEKFDVNVQNLKGSLGTLINHAISPTVDSLNEAMSSVTHLTDSLSDLSELSPEFAKNFSYIEAAFTGFLNALVPTLPLFLLFGKAAEFVADKIDDHNEQMRRAEGSQSDFGKAVEETIPVVNEFAEIIAQEDFADKWSSTVDKLLEKQADLNRSWINAMQDWEAESIDIANDLNDKLLDIQRAAMDDRADAWSDFADKMEDLQYQLADRMREIQHDLTISQRNEDNSYDDRKRELERRKYETVRDFAQKQEALLKDVNEAKTAEERAAAEERLRIAQREMQDKLDDIDYDMSELKRKHEREKTEIDERYRWEQERFAEHNARQQQELQDALNKKLEAITANEIEATAKANEESEKRTAKALEDLEKTKAEIDEKFKQAWLDALLAVVPEGSKLHDMLEVAKLKAMGATNEMLVLRDSLKEVGTTADGLQSIFAKLGLGSMAGSSAWNTLAMVYQLMHPFGRASGGGTSAGKPYLVGENGPELLLSAGQSVVPMQQSSGGGNTVVIQASGPFLGSEADAIRWGNALIPVIAKALQRYNVNVFATGSRRTETSMR